MQVGQMLVRVRHRLVLVPMRVRLPLVPGHRNVAGRVHMTMMLIVHVRMLVCETLVPVPVRMVLGDQQQRGHDHQAERHPEDAAGALVEREQRDIERDPNGEVRELTEYWRAKGLSDEVARAVAEQLHATDALSAQLEWEYGFDEPLPRSEPIWAGAIEIGRAHV